VGSGCLLALPFRLEASGIDPCPWEETTAATWEAGTTLKPVVALRPVPCVAYFDESGHFRPPSFGQPNEACTVGVFVTSDSTSERAAVRDLVNQIRARHAVRHGMGARYDADGLAESDLEVVADVMRAHDEEWKVGYFHLSLTERGGAEFREMMRALASAVRTKAGDLRGADALDLRPLVAVARIERMSDANMTYLSLWFHALRKTLLQFRDWGILPLMRAVIDRRPGLDDRDVLDLVGRVAHGVIFDEVYGERLGELMGVRPTNGFSASIGGDEGTPGLVVADLIT
jgi:hypothetical protein